VPVIKAINPDELPQITYVIYYKSQDKLKEAEKQIYLRQIANIIKNKLKVIDNVTTLDVV